MSVTSASASATFTADELIVETATKQQYRLSSVNKTVNLGTTGEGGMDTGTVPASGFVGLYVIYNPTTDTSAMLAVNATSASAPEIYGGANMPAGYTASALVSVWRVSSGKFIIGIQRGRKITISPHMVLASSISAASYTSLDISSCVPRNAQSVDGSGNPNITGTGSNTNISVASLVDGTGSVSIGCGGAAINAPFSDIQIATAQTIYYTLTASTALQTSYIYIRGYEI
ncbi:phage tail protein [Escherichia coli]|nr:phage tail protein [Escherichia coli]